MQSLSIGKDSFLWALENLSSAGAVKLIRDQSVATKITEEGKGYLAGFPEERLASALYNSGGKQETRKIKNEIGLIWAKKNGWIMIEKNEIKLTAKGKEIAQGKVPYLERELLKRLNEANSAKLAKLIEDNKDAINDLKHRNIIEIATHGSIKKIEITPSGMDPGRYEEGIGTLTRDMITSGKWKSEKFRKYDINAPTEETPRARLHPLHEFLDVIRRTWLNMGFTEVSGPIIEPAFWVFDALFSPQDHPTREMQDTFFLKNPPEISIDDMALMKRVKSMHLKGWKDKWREDVARQAILRTHTTSVSAHSMNMFSNLENTRYPIKLFSIGRNFRNESIDYKHLAEFYMVDGIIIGNNLTLSNLIHTLKQFYTQIGMDKIVFRPAYFPFVEPGTEFYYYDERKKDTIELGGAGIIRKEITRAMGTNKTVLAWGPGLDRLMIKSLGLDNLTELYKNDIGWLRKRGELKI